MLVPSILKKYLFIYFGCPGSELQHEDFLVAACGLLSCGMWTLSCGMHVGSSSLTKDRTRTHCTGSAESYPLDHQWSPNPHHFLKQILESLPIYSSMFQLYNHVVKSQKKTILAFWLELHLTNTLLCVHHWPFQPGHLHPRLAYVSLLIRTT